MNNDGMKVNTIEFHGMMVIIYLDWMYWKGMYCKMRMKFSLDWNDIDIAELYHLRKGHAKIF